jgi:hypothetical protein
VNTYKIRITETAVQFTTLSAADSTDARERVLEMYRAGRIPPGEPEVSVTVLSREGSE